MRLILSALVAAAVAPSQAALVVENEYAVTDSVTGRSWYRNMQTLVGQTYTQQQQSVVALNQANTGGHGNWQIAGWSDLLPLLQNGGLYQSPNVFSYTNTTSPQSIAGRYVPGSSTYWFNDPSFNAYRFVPSQNFETVFSINPLNADAAVGAWVVTAAVPEPAEWALFAAGLLVIAYTRYSRTAVRHA